MNQKHHQNHQTNEYVQKLTGKNPQDFEFAAAHIINNSDVEAFSALVEKSGFLFDFIKENVKKRLSAVINETNFKNLFAFLNIYSCDYEDLIVSTLVKFADEDLTDKMLELLEDGSESEKAYSAKYFVSINDTLAIDFLRKYSYSDFDPLALNCAEALSAMKDETSYNSALEKLKFDDEFEKLSAVRFLITYKDTRALPIVFEAMKKSSMPENIASEIPYLKSFIELLDTEYKKDTILAINHILSGLGEIVMLGQLFDFQLFEVLDKLIRSQSQTQLAQKDSKTALVLLNAKSKFEQLTENDEYIFDEDKMIKAEVYEIKNLLNAQGEIFWNEQKQLFQAELNSDSDFIFSALELTQELNLSETFDRLKELLSKNNQTLILKTIEVLKSLNKLSEIDKKSILEKISDENIKAIINSLFSN